MLKSFPIGGVHPSENKLSRGAAIETFPVPETVTIPLSQHIGAPAVAAVAKGDKVVVGQVIATAGGFVSSNIHSSVSGTVTAVDAAVNGQGLRQPAVTIKVEGDEWDPAIDRSDKLVRECNLEPKEIIAKIQAAGIVGMGGATFPAHVKLSVPPGKKAEFLIINGVECEPYLTSDHRVMLERGEELLVGVTILMKALGVNKAFIGIENNKPDAIAHLTSLAAAYAGVEVVPLKVQYPQGGEKQLIAAVTGRQVPSAPALPIDVGAVVQNASTAVAVYEAVQKNKPLIERVVTVTGKGLAKPGNFKVRIGTPISALIAAAGGLPEDAGKVINGGPMMGRAMVNLDAPVTKGSSGVLVMSGSEACREAADTCIKCGKCVNVCPMGLEPYLLSKLSRKGMWEQAEKGIITDCIECGSCQFTCPAHLPLLDFIRLGKAKVMGIIRARAAAAAPKK
ncbi:MAG: electron transport complex subunit RsxC [Rikenellaceae bacterium]|nr:electron transport complex subunit RsxC [Rikenellaceae bacterium]